MTARKPPVRPTSVKVGWADFSISYIANEEWGKKHPNHEDDSGLMWAVDQTIAVRCQDEVHEQVIRETLLHEIMHAVWYISYLTYKKPNEFLDFEEEIVRHSSGPMLSVLQDNPILVKYLLG